MPAAWKRVVFAEELGELGGVNLTNADPTAIAEGASAVGVSEEAARADHFHGYTDPSPAADDDAPVALSGAAASVAGIDGAYSRGDHAHGFAPTQALDFAQQEIQRAVIHNAGATAPDSGTEVPGQIYYDGTHIYVWTDTDGV